MIAIDIRFLSDNIKNGIISSGVGVFFNEIVEGLRINDLNNYFALIIDEKGEKSARKLFPDFNVIVLDYHFSNNNNILLYPFHYFFDGRELRRLAEKNDINCIWFPMASPFWFLHTGLKTISTIHDIIPLHENPGSLSWKYGIKYIIKKSSIVVTNSDYVKNDIIETFNLSSIYSNKIYKIPGSVICNEDISEFAPELKNKRFLLDVNAYQERKNAFTLIKAFHLIRNETDCDLVFCGGYNENNTLDKMQIYCKELGIEDRVHFFLSIPIENRNWLMKNAEMLISPSLSEGFGRSPVEAAMYKIPVLTTRCDSLYEVTQGLVSYYDNPMDYDELAKCIMKLLSSRPSQKELDDIANQLIFAYSPERISSLYNNLFIQ